MDLAGREQGVLETKAGVRSTRARLAQLARDHKSSVEDIRKATSVLCYGLISHYQLADLPGWEGFSQFRLTGKLVAARDEEAANEFWRTAESCRALAAEVSGLPNIAPSLNLVADVTQATVFARHCIRAVADLEGGNRTLTRRQAASLLAGFVRELESGMSEAAIGADACVEAAREDIKELAPMMGWPSQAVLRIKSLFGGSHGLSPVPGF